MNLVRIGISIYLLLLAVAWLTDSTSLWGIYHLKFVPGPVAWMIIILAMAIVWLPDTLLRSVSQRLNRKLNHGKGVRLFAVLAVCMAALFIIARAKVLMLGDSYKLIAQITEPLIFLPTEQLNLILHNGVYRITGSAEISYLIVSVIAGIGFLAVIAVFLSKLTDRLVGRLAGVTLFLGLAQMQFFFGYVENYTVMTVFVCLFLSLGWQSVRNKSPVWPAYLALVAAGAFHMSALFLLPGLVYLLWERSKGDKNAARYKSAAAVTVAAAVIGGILFYLKFEGDEIFCPIVATEQNPYTLFSLQHLTDIGNLLLLIAPLPLFLTIAAIRNRGFRRSMKNQEIAFLTACLTGGLCLLLFVDPKLGAVRDWDLLSLYGIPLTFLCTLLWLGSKAKRAISVPMIQLGLAILIAHTLPWVASNASSDIIYDDLKQIVHEDIHFTPEYYKGDRLMGWGLIAYHLHNDIGEKQRSFGLRLTAQPDDERSWIFYASACRELGQRDRVREALPNIKHPGSLGQGQLELLTSLQLHTGNTNAAKHSLAIFADTYPENFAYHFHMGLAAQLEGDNQLAADSYRRALEIKPGEINLLLNYAAVALNLRNTHLTDSLLNVASQLPNLTDKDMADISKLRQAVTSP